MKKGNALVGLVLLLMVGGSGYFGYRYFVLANEQCDICGRAVHSEHQAALLLKDGGKAKTCCPRCALHYENSHPGLVKELRVADHETGKEIEAQKAIYIEGSDEHSCVADSDAGPREPGIEYERKYDRCLPSLLAFTEDSAARQFMREHGGRLLSFAQAADSAKTR